MLHHFKWVLLSVLLATQIPGVGHAQRVAQITTPAPGWCQLDAPGDYRKLRAISRSKGERTVGECPQGGRPETLPERLVVPLPCGRALDMRRIDVPATGVLDHLSSGFGGAPEGASILTIYAQGGRDAVLSGTFSRRLEARGGGKSIGYADLGYRSYYVSSHEWTVLQQALYRSGAFHLWSKSDRVPTQAESQQVCAALDQMTQGLRFSDVLPAGNVSWYEAQATVGAMNEYVMAESRRRIAAGAEPLVPWEQGSSGFFRLPSEVEWEYAAMGGAPGALDQLNGHLVRDQNGQIRAPELSEIAVLSNGRTSGHLRGVGSLAPNIVGLYDIIGNVAEMTHDLFSMVRPDSPHGGRGGIVLRGGNALTPQSVIGIGHRLELPLHTIEGAGKTSFGGMRLILSAPMLPRGFDPSGNRAPDRQNVELSRVLEEEHKRIVAIRGTPGATFRDEAQRLLSAIEDEADQTSSVDAARVAGVRRALEQSEAAINAAQEAEVSAKIRSAADAIFAMRSLSALAIVWHEKLDQAEELVRSEFPADERPSAEKRIRQARKDIFLRTDIINVQVRDIGRMITRLSEISPEMVDRLTQQEKTRLQGIGVGLYDEYLVWDKLDAAVLRVRARGNEDHFVWQRAQFDVFRDKRIDRWGTK